MEITYLIKNQHRPEVMRAVTPHTEALLKSIRENKPQEEGIALVRDGEKCLGAYIRVMNIHLDSELRKMTFDTASDDAILFVCANDNIAVCSFGCPPSTDYIETYIRMAFVPAEAEIGALPRMAQEWYATVPDIEHNRKSIIAIANILISACIHGAMYMSTQESWLSFGDGCVVGRVATRALCEVMGATTTEEYAKLPLQYARAVACAMDRLGTLCSLVAGKAAPKLPGVSPDELLNATTPIIMEQWLNVYSQMQRYLHIASLVY